MPLAHVEQVLLARNETKVGAPVIKFIAIDMVDYIPRLWLPDNHVVHFHYLHPTIDPVPMCCVATLPTVQKPAIHAHSLEIDVIDQRYLSIGKLYLLHAVSSANSSFAADVSIAGRLSVTGASVGLPAGFSTSPARISPNCSLPIRRSISVSGISDCL